jgi:glyceraldehyde-3-phosphate dehydrogenase (ferredoxin)
MKVLRVELGAGARASREVSPAWGPVELAAEERASATVMGAGPLGREDIPGSNRLVFAGWAPAWRGFYVSTMGSAGAAMRVTGADAVVFEGRCARPSAIVLSASAEPRLIEMSLPEAWRGERPGTHAILAAVAARASLPGARILAVGPGAATTTFGAVASAVVNGVAPVLETWAGRGGFGSKLLGAHNLVAVVLDVPASSRPQPRPRAAAMPEPREVEEAMRKYRYQPRLQAGGTLGANLASLRDRLLAFNHRSMHWSRERREEIHARLVEGHYLAQHRRDTDGGRKGKDCGEICPAQCRRVTNGLKKDFQPFAALGPSIGVFDQRAAERVYALVEELGVDAIDAGALVAWWMERIASGTASPEDAGASRAPVFEPDDFDAERDSHVNAQIAVEILRAQLFGSGPPRHLAEITAADPDRAVVVVNDAGGGVAPTQYWVPGVVAPTPVVGKYYTYYGMEPQPARELGRSCGERTVAELALDNVGLCRFQREWAERKLDDLLVGVGIELGEGAIAHHRRLAARLARSAPVPQWRGARVREIVATWAREGAEDDPDNHSAVAQADAFARDPTGAARAFYEDLRSGIAEGLDPTAVG